MKLFILFFSFIFVFCVISANAYAEGNAEKGAVLFKKNCRVCHKSGLKTKISKAIIGSTAEQLTNAIDGTSKNVSKKYKMMVKAMKKKKFSKQDIEDIAAFLNK